MIRSLYYWLIKKHSPRESHEAYCHRCENPCWDQNTVHCDSPNWEGDCDCCQIGKPLIQSGGA